MELMAAQNQRLAPLANRFAETIGRTLGSASPRCSTCEEIQKSGSTFEERLSSFSGGKTPEVRARGEPLLQVQLRGLVAETCRVGLSRPPCLSCKSKHLLP